MSEQDVSTQRDNMTLPRAHRPRLGGRLSKQEREQAQKTFLSSYRRTANITAACQKAHISRNTLYQWKEHDVPFSMLYEQSDHEATDVLFAAAWKRGVKGVRRVITSMGKPVKNENGKVMTEQEYSDTILLRLMSYRVPGFSERKQIDTHAEVHHHEDDLRKGIEAMDKEKRSLVKQWLLEALTLQSE